MQIDAQGKRAYRPLDPKFFFRPASTIRAEQDSLARGELASRSVAVKNTSHFFDIVLLGGRRG